MANSGMKLYAQFYYLEIWVIGNALSSRSFKNKKAEIAYLYICQ